MLGIHNQTRVQAGVAPLQWSAELEQGARVHAQRLANARRLFHSDGAEGSGMGENLWAGTRGAYDVPAMFEIMVGEGRDFRPGRFPNVSRTGQWRDVGHYTQIVWPTTEKVGCAVAANASDEYLVCRYYPSGNVIGYALR